MQIAIHCNQFDGRGTGKVPYEYAVYLSEYLNSNILFVTSAQSSNEGLIRIKKKFPVITYDAKSVNMQSPIEQQNTKNILERIVDDEKIDFFHFIKSGENDNITPSNCTTGIHCVFKMNEPHGNVYAGVSEYLSKKYNRNLYVPHIIQPITPNCDYRQKYNIPKDALIVGRHGGTVQFNIPFVHDAIKLILEHRPDIFFLFLSTEPFMTHERVIFIPWVENEQEVFNFINACDVMLHGREDGETFGLSIAEFSASNKPVITWSGMWKGQKHLRYDTCHIDLLEDRAIIYNNEQDLVDILFSIDKNFISNHNWDKYSIKFSPKNVIDQYKKIFLKNFYK